MKNQEENLFKIGEVTRITGVSRKALLIYEEMGLLVPAVKGAESGYRYYSADNMTQICSIRALQSLGLTLKEVGEYYYDTENLEAHLQRLIELRDSLDRSIQRLQMRAAGHGDMTVRETHLPRQVCFCRRYRCENVWQAADKLREIYIAAARTGKMSMTERMFTQRFSQPGEPMELMGCIPVEADFEGPERIEFAATPALCIYYRGPYEGIGDAIRVLLAYAKEHEVTVTGPFRSIYLEGPPNRGGKSSDYITLIALPIRRFR